jgi:hypothetical protein
MLSTQQNVGYQEDSTNSTMLPHIFEAIFGPRPYSIGCKKIPPMISLLPTFLGFDIRAKKGTRPVDTSHNQIDQIIVPLDAANSASKI